MIVDINLPGFKRYYHRLSAAVDIDIDWTMLGFGFGISFNPHFGIILWIPFFLVVWYPGRVNG